MIKLTDNGLTDDDLDAIAREDITQIEQWGYAEHSIDTWLVILGEEYGELCNAALSITSMSLAQNPSLSKIVEREALQLATLALKIKVMIAKRAKELRLEV